MRSMWRLIRNTFNHSDELPVADGFPPDEEGVFWGGVYLPLSEATSHFMCLGATGSGKSLTMRLLMQRVLPSIGAGSDSRALVYDAKQDALPLLHAICPHARIRTTNSFDPRGVAWDLAADIREPRLA